MAKLIEYDVSDVEESSGGTGIKVKPGVRIAEIVRCQQRTEKRNGEPANDLEVALSFGSDFDWIFTYIGLEQSSDWKLAELVRAVGLKDKGKLDPDKLKGKIIRVKVNHGEYGGEYRPEAGRLMPAQRGDEVGGSVAQSASDEPDAKGDIDADNDTPPATSYKEGFEPSREDDPEVGSYDEWEEADLLGEVEDRGLTLAGGRGKKKDKAIAALREEDATVTGDAQPDADEPAAQSGDEYDDWSVDELTKEYEERQFDDPVPIKKGRNAEQRTKDAIIEALREDDEQNPFEG